MTTYQQKQTWNEVTFTGRLGRDPEMSYTAKGNACTKFSLAVNQGRDKDAMWLDVTCWQDLAEQVNTDAAKGALVEVKGRLSQRKYQGRYYHEVVAKTVEVIETKKGSTTTSRQDADDLGELDDHPF